MSLLNNHRNNLELVACGLKLSRRRNNNGDPDLKITHTQLETRGSQLAATTPETIGVFQIITETTWSLRLEAIQKEINNRDPDLKIAHTQLETRGSQLAATLPKTSVFSK